MALTRKLLKGMGLTDEQVDTIIEAHSDTVDGLKEDLKKAKADADKLPEVQKELDDLKAKGDDGWKDKHDKVKKDFEDYKDAQTKKEARAAKETAYRKFLKDNCNISEKYIEDVMGVAKLDDLELENGAFKDAENLAKTIQEKYAPFVTKKQTGGASVANPPAAGGTGSGKTREEINAIKDGAVRRAEMAKNPHLFPEINS